MDRDARPRAAQNRAKSVPRRIEVRDLYALSPDLRWEVLESFAP